MRLRNVKHAKQMIHQHPEIIIPHPEKFRGSWTTCFGNQYPIHLEIGCGKGQFIVEKAKQYPTINFIGIEKFDSVIIRALEKTIEQPCDNLRLIRMDAENLLHVFAPHEVAQIYLNFSDPWPKKRTAKRRLTSPQFLQRYRHILKKDAHILLKSDNFGFYQYSMMCFNQDDQFAFEKLQLDLYRDLPSDNIATEFESKFIEEGKLIHFLNVKFKGEKE